MKKADCETAIRHLCGVWSKETNTPQTAESEPSFSEFWNWVESRFPAYLRFRTTTSVHDDVEMWFDDEFNQAWRN